jgi:hypothetical protein
MKTNAGKAALFAAVTLAIAPFASRAQNVAGTAGTVSRGAERVTLLPGPSLLSPARGAPQATESIRIDPAPVKTGHAPVFRFVPATDGAKRSPDERAPMPTFTSGKRTPTPAKTDATPPSSLPRPESLRFEEKLHPSVPAPKRD